MDSATFGVSIVSGVFGLLVTFLWFLLLLRLTGQEIGKAIFKAEFFLTGLLTGIVERLFFTAIIGWSGSGGVVPAMIGWIALKGQLHYHIFTKGRKNNDIERVYLAILGSIFSLLIAFIGGVLWEREFQWILDAGYLENFQAMLRVLSTPHLAVVTGR